MPTPMTPSKPLTPAAALAQKAQANLAASGGANVPAGQNSTADKLKALASGEDPNAPLGAKTPGDKAFSIITPKDPNGTMHIFAKNAQDAKVKYKQLGDPLGGATQAVEIKETDVAEGFDKWGWHTSVDNGEFMPTKYGNKNYVYLHDLDSESPNGGPQLVTFNKPTHAKKAASKFGGRVVKTDLNTYRVVKPIEQEVAEAGYETPGDKVAKKLEKIARKGASQIGWDYAHRDDGGSLSKDESDPYGNYKQGWIQKNKPSHKPRKASKSKDMEESMTTLKTTFEGIEDSIASILESFGLENGRDFYIDGTIRTLDEQVAQDILSVLADHDLPGQANLRQLEEGWAISLIGQGEELVENLTVGNDDIEIRHIGEGVVRVYVNHELAEQFDTGTAAFKYVKALQQNLAEADNELMSALSAEAGEDLMKIDKITEGWSEWEEKKASYKKAGATVDGKEDDYTVTSKDGSRKRYQNTKSGRKVTSLPPVEGKGEVDSEGNKVKRGRGRPKKVRESLEAIRTMRKQVTEALAKIDRLPEAQRNTPQVQAMVDRLTESVKKAIARAK